MPKSKFSTLKQVTVEGKQIDIVDEDYNSEESLSLDSDNELLIAEPTPDLKK